MERIQTHLYDSHEDASSRIAGQIAELIRARAAEGRHAVLGLATGDTPIGLYQQLIRMHRQEGLDFSNVITFNLDEYWPIDPKAPQSYHAFMQRKLFDHINIPADQTNVPDGCVPRDDVDDFCRRYEARIQEAGGIGLQILGIGRTGHIGFNEPGSTPDSITHLVRLDRMTRNDAARDFFGEQNVPQYAITMGIGTILAAKEICLLAFGEHKADILAQAVEGEVTAQIAASFLQQHPNAGIHIDRAAARSLTRTRMPWLTGSWEWTEAQTRKAVIWLAQQREKPILELTYEDYADNGLYDLLAEKGNAYNLNLQVFYHLKDTITGWPGGRDGGKRVVVFSPHPDDDVLFMGATLERLCRHGHEVHTVYMTDGVSDVFDHDALRFAEFAHGFNEIFGLAKAQTAQIDRHIEAFLRKKNPGAEDSDEVKSVKSLIRRTEAVAAAGHCGVPEENCHFLDLSFSDGHGSVSQVQCILDDLQPDLLFAAGEHCNPWGSHWLCWRSIQEALQITDRDLPEVWLYRGTWDEWQPHLIDWAVPVCPQEIFHKRQAIFRHQSQLGRMLYPAIHDKREFWQRAEDRIRHTAQVYDKLGLPQYAGIEAFVQWSADQ